MLPELDLTRSGSMEEFPESDLCACLWGLSGLLPDTGSPRPRWVTPFPARMVLSLRRKLVQHKPSCERARKQHPLWAPLDSTVK